MNGLILCTKECNLRCKYCFEETMHECCSITSSKEIQNNFNYFLDKYFDKFIRELITINASLGRTESDITFHGGEPLLVGYDMLRQGFEMVKKYTNTTIGIQTNGTLITDDIIDLFKQYDVRVGISIDGPKYMHDKYRKNIAGEDTFNKTYDNIIKMKSAGVVVGGLATVTDITVKNARDFYEFFRDNKLDFTFNPCFTNPNSYPSYNGLDMNEYNEFYKEMFDLWINDNDVELSISCFERILSAMCVKNQVYMEVCTYIPDCSKTTLAINTDGDFYRCLHYCMDENNKIGNISIDSLDKGLGNCNISNRWEYLKQNECKDCDIQDFCCGGCPYVAESLNGSMMTKANTCTSQKVIVQYLYDYLKQFVNGK